jgi:hypothetical protein
MPHASKLVAAFVVAPLAPVAIFETLNGDSFGWLIVLPLVVSYLHLVLGLPIFLWLRAAGRLSTSSVLLASSLVGAVPIASVLATGGVSYFSSVGGVVTAKDGALTSAGIADVVGLILRAAALGFSAGLVWRIVAGSPANYRMERP